MIKNILLIITSIGICLILGEGLIRVIQPQQLIMLRQDIWRPQEGFGWHHRENVNTIVNTGEGSVHFRTDREGHRINIANSGVEEKFELRFLVLGDSFLEALAIENERTIPELLKRQIKYRLNKVVKIDNTGVAGWEPNRYLIQAKSSLSKHKYNIGITFLYIGNDIIDHKYDWFPPRTKVKKTWRMPVNLTWKEILDAVVYPFNETMERNSHLYVFWKNSSQRLLAKVGLVAIYFPDVLLTSERDSKRWELTAEICREIQEEFERHSTPVVFVLLPSPLQVHQDMFENYVDYFSIDKEAVDLEQPNRLLLEHFEKRKLKLVDVLLVLREKAKKGLRMYGRIDTHLNENGHEVIANALLPVVEGLLLRSVNIGGKFVNVGSLLDSKRSF